MCEKQDGLNQWMRDGYVEEKMRGPIKHSTFHTVQVFPSSRNMYKETRQAALLPPDLLHEQYPNILESPHVQDFTTFYLKIFLQRL